MRTPILAGNWKMHKTAAEAEDLVSRAMDPLLALDMVERVFCPPFLAIPKVAEMVADTPLGVGAQDLYWEESGAYTGEVSPAMVAEFCDYVIIGHSERRAYFGETDETVNKKIVAALKHDLTPIVCVGETLEQREAGKTETWVAGQVRAALDGLTSAQVSGLVSPTSRSGPSAPGWPRPPMKPSVSSATSSGRPCARSLGPAPRRPSASSMAARSSQAMPMSS